ncbi:DUF86 domain-containing protein [Streptococcus pluranimalium]|uniref:HepT-like ribonuclease domain-containing protein n=1 Tax=Streptococcus pluranimalium TaxID=82348 RepID=UPI0039FDAA6A
MRIDQLEADYMYLKEMIYYAEKVQEVVPKANRYGIPLDDDMVIASLTMMIGQVGEQIDSQKLSESFKEKYSDIIDWKVIKGFRNLAYHHYSKISAKQVIEITAKFIPELLEGLYTIRRQVEKELSE